MEVSCTPTLDGMLGYEAAVEQLVAAAVPIEDEQPVDLHAALGRVLAQPVISGVDVPGWDYSAMDGYAVRTQDCGIAGTELPISQRVPAGVSPSPLAPGTEPNELAGAYDARSGTLAGRTLDDSGDADASALGDS